MLGLNFLSLDRIAPRPERTPTEIADAIERALPDFDVRRPAFFKTRIAERVRLSPVEKKKLGNSLQILKRRGRIRHTPKGWKILRKGALQ